MATKAREHLIRDRDRTEAALVAGARSLVMGRPYESIRVREIAEVVGCNHGLITHYFGTKLGLFTRVLKEIGDELNASIPQLETPRQLIDHPLTGTYWRLMAALLEAGLDPADALNAGAPGVNAIVRRGEELTGRDLGKDRASVGFLLLAVGGYQVFGDVLAPTISPSGDDQEAVDAFGRFLTLLIRGLMAE